jgi:hypothetical protein
MRQALGNIDDFDALLLLHNSTMVLPRVSGTCSQFQRFDNSPRAPIAISKHGAQDVRNAVKIRHPLLRSRLRFGRFTSGGLGMAGFRTRLFHPKRLILQVQIHHALRGRQRTIAAGSNAVMT